MGVPVATSGCATRADGSVVTIADDAGILMTSADGLTRPEAMQLARVQRYAEMRVSGATAGALLGIIAGLLIADDNRGAGAAIGGVAGASLGYLAGAYVANLNSVAEDRRGSLQGQLAAARNAVSETKGATRDIREIVRAERRRIDRLNQDYRAGRITQEQYRRAMDTLQTKISIIDESIRVAENDVDAINLTLEQQRQGGANVARLRRERDRMQGEVRKLRRELDSLLAAVATIPPEIGVAGS